MEKKIHKGNYEQHTSFTATLGTSQKLRIEGYIATSLLLIPVGKRMLTRLEIDKTVDRASIFILVSINLSSGDSCLLHNQVKLDYSFLSDTGMVAVCCCDFSSKYPLGFIVLSEISLDLRYRRTHLQEVVWIISQVALTAILLLVKCRVNLSMTSDRSHHRRRPGMGVSLYYLPAAMKQRHYHEHKCRHDEHDSRCHDSWTS